MVASSQFSAQGPDRKTSQTHDDVDYLLAHVNIGRMREPLDSPLLADFVAALDPVNAAADAAPGFIWRLHTEGSPGTCSLIRRR
jgi:Domain of unknown function (DUF3291)